jgi:hypothetical protein
MSMPETDARDDLLNDFQEIILGTLSDLSGRQGRGRVSHEQQTQAFLHPRARDRFIDSIGDIDRFFGSHGLNRQQMSHRNDP